MKNVIVTVVMLAIAVGLVLSVVIPIADKSKTSGSSAETMIDTAATYTTGLTN